MALNEIKKVYFSGIGGIGVSALARIYKAQGREVIGSDLTKTELTSDLESLGIKIFYSQEEKNITADIDLLIYSPALDEDHVERKTATSFDIEQKSYPEMLGELMKSYNVGIGISGTNGKSTTTSILGLIMDKAELDPTVVVGSKVKKFNNSNTRIGAKNYFLVEACEYKESMLNLEPQIIGLTNIEEDHLDYYKDLTHILGSFQKFINKLSTTGLLSINVDDENSQKLDLPNCQITNFGIDNDADVMAQEIRIENKRQIFNLIYKGEDIGTISLKVPGKYNIYNALLAISIALFLGVEFTPIKEALEEYSGIWRRFEVIGDRNDITFISDYAHHPTAVKETLKAAREFYPKNRIVVAFQPHQHSRTKKLFDDFVGAFDKADLLILSEIYNVSGRNEDDDVSSNDLVPLIKKRKVNAFYSPDVESTGQMLKDNIQPGDVVLIVGAGDIYKLVSQLYEN